MPSEDPFSTSGVLSEPLEVLAENAMRASAAAWATVGADVEEQAVPVPPGKMTAALGAGACALDAAVHAWDIAVALGRPSPLTPDMARELLDVAERIVEPSAPSARTPPWPRRGRATTTWPPRSTTSAVAPTAM